MKPTTNWIVTMGLSLLAVAVFAGNGIAQLNSGQAAPLFSAKDVHGKSYQISDMKDQPMLILYFFDVDSRSSQEGLLHLDGLAKKYKEADMKVWAITRATTAKVNQFLSSSKLDFPVVVDPGDISTQYSARLILPTVCIIGPDLKLLDYIQGGGKATEKSLVAIAERKLQSRQTTIAKAISAEVVKKDPKNVRAQSVQGYAALKEGDLKAAEKAFYKLSREKGEGELLGKEGLSHVYARKGQPEKAISMATEVEKKSQQRAYAHVIKGDLYYSRNNPRQAEAEYLKAAKSAGADPSHRAVAFNQLGRIYAVRGDYHKSMDMYDQAVALDPYYVEATSNKGMTYERQGEWDKALEAYRRAHTIDRSDPFTATLAENAKRMLLMEKDPETRKTLERRIDTIVKNYHQAQTAAAEHPEDPWTSGHTALVLFEAMETGGLSLRDGFARMLNLSLADQLNTSGRIEVIDPIVLERVVDKLALKDKDLSDQTVMLRLSRACGARLMGKGTLFHLSEGALLKFELYDALTQHRAQAVERQFASTVTLKKDLHWLNREVLTAIVTDYPLQAYVVEVSGHQVLLNLGARQGVVTGTLFEIVEEKPAKVFKGKTFKPDAAIMATVEVMRVEDEFSYAHIKDQRRPVTVEDKLRESIRNMTEDAVTTW
ncbi:MAG: tetratricopeptide repeat protein [Desulfatitalea sp.]|nr:tetratricopeptide repeat protein [Desulfatitalea sp.]NNK01988.1 tetratricopeptide repeat protein [Desulfatitalea sp.]